jgi:hypothetical protein
MVRPSQRSSLPRLQSALKVHDAVPDRGVQYCIERHIQFSLVWLRLEAFGGVNFGGQPQEERPSIFWAALPVARRGAARSKDPPILSSAIRARPSAAGSATPQTIAYWTRAQARRTDATSRRQLISLVSQRFPRSRNREVPTAHGLLACRSSELVRRAAHGACSDDWCCLALAAVGNRPIGLVR